MARIDGYGILFTWALLWSIGWPLLISSVLGSIFTMILILPGVYNRMDAEENELLRNYGEEYLSNRERTWRLLPFLY